MDMARPFAAIMKIPSESKNSVLTFRNEGFSKPSGLYLTKTLPIKTTIRKMVGKIEIMASGVKRYPSIFCPDEILFLTESRYENSKTNRRNAGVMLYFLNSARMIYRIAKKIKSGGFPPDLVSIFQAKCESSYLAHQKLQV